MFIKYEDAVWVIFGKYKWTRHCVQLAEDEFVRRWQTFPTREQVESMLRTAFAAYRHPA